VLDQVFHVVGEDLPVKLPFSKVRAGVRAAGSVRLLSSLSVSHLQPLLDTNYWMPVRKVNRARVWCR
jgi:hypothetical protein